MYFEHDRKLKTILNWEIANKTTLGPKYEISASVRNF